MSIVFTLLVAALLCCFTQGDPNSELKTLEECKEENARVNMEIFTLKRKRDQCHDDLEELEKEKEESEKRAKEIREKLRHELEAERNKDKTCNAPSSNSMMKPPVKLNTEICEHYKAFYSESGDFLKYACLVDKSVNYEVAQYQCWKNGMDLLTVETEDVYNELVTFLSGIFLELNDFWLYLNGRKFNSDTFVYKRFEKKPLSSALPFMDEPIVPGDCMALYKYYGSNDYEAEKHSCVHTHRFICEFESRI